MVYEVFLYIDNNKKLIRFSIKNLDNSEYVYHVFNMVEDERMVEKYKVLIETFDDLYNYLYKYDKLHRFLNKAKILNGDLFEAYDELCEN